MKLKCIAPDDVEYDLELKGEWTDEQLREMLCGRLKRGFRYFVFDGELSNGVKVGREIKP